MQFLLNHIYIRVNLALKNFSVLVYLHAYILSGSECEIELSNFG